MNGRKKVNGSFVHAKKAQQQNAQAQHEGCYFSFDEKFNECHLSGGRGLQSKQERLRKVRFGQP